MDLGHRHLIDLRVFNRLARERRQHDLEHVKRREKHRKEEAEREGDEDVLAFAALAFQAAEIERLRTRITEYDAATVEALQRNTEELAAAEARVQAMLDNAFALPDGRRVFRTENGQQVFDEFGDKVSEDKLDPDVIPEHRTSWEDYEEAVEEGERVRDERQDLIDYQERLDDARDRLDEGGLTEDELDDIAADLEASMPSAVREELRTPDEGARPGNQPDDSAPGIERTGPGTMLPTSAP